MHAKKAQQDTANAIKSIVHTKRHASANKRIGE